MQCVEHEDFEVNAVEQTAATSLAVYPSLYELGVKFQRCMASLDRSALLRMAGSHTLDEFSLHHRMAL